MIEIKFAKVLNVSKCSLLADLHSQIYSSTEACFYKKPFGKI